MRPAIVRTRSAPSGRLRQTLRRALLAWFEAERRDLPWRRTREPFAIWISEAMLQQTRVETVIPFYHRFLARFPDVAALAAAEEGEVLALWSGLGYYSRARALRAAARVLVERNGGALPDTRAGWLELPGVGPYTAGAVLSIAYSQSEPLVDGNVQRVFARLFALEEPQGSRELSVRCWALAHELVPAASEPDDPGDWNQALMELGARLCRPRTPDCERCPLRRRCLAYAAGRTQELPHSRAGARQAVREVCLEILVPLARGKLLCSRRPATGRMAGLLEFPTRERVAAGAAPHLWPKSFALALEARAPLGEITHTITQHRIRALVRSARCGACRLPESSQWFAPEALAALALTGLARKVLALPSLRERLGSAGAEP